ncbi:MAG: DEAD/DEAH box helicase family protein [Muribaculaceae bacterium]|nr:DEAD/DEAH box helicase family protein [Muribaculaceae bacterium]
MTPEQKARQIIDRIFRKAGWGIVDRDNYSPELSAVAIEEGLMRDNLEADYLMFLNGKAVAVLEAKRAEVDVYDHSVIQQAENYTLRVVSWCQTFQNPLPLVYISNGNKIIFRDMRDSESEYIEIPKIHTPKEIKAILGIEDYYAGLPILDKEGLRDCQFEAITNLEQSFRAGYRKGLINIATGAGKTWTACLASYRMLNYTPMKKILFLVDRKNLGEQAESEFGNFKLTESGDAFNTIFAVERLKSNRFDTNASVFITTIQKLFSFLKGEASEEDDIDKENSDDDNPSSPIVLPPNPTIPKDFFDMIIIDECHRSIYGNWRPVLEYFENAKLIGLTATPSPETIEFFDYNIICNYTLDQSIKDKVNVPARIYRIKTKVTQGGGAINEGDPLRKVTRYTGNVEQIKSTDTELYSASDLNRNIVNPAQIKLILETYKNAVYSELFNDPPREPNLNFLPKTLIFAANEDHATNIVKIAKEVFERNDDVFVQKITCKSGDSKALIKSFNTSRDFRIAVTVTLVATGTDVKPIEVVMFMRDVESDQLYQQMKGRGVRTLSPDLLRNVTPNAHSKECYILVDAVGVTEHEHSLTSPTTETNNPSLTLSKLLERITHGEVSDENLSLLASKLTGIDRRTSESDKNQFTSLVHINIIDIATNIYNALSSGSLPQYLNVNEPNSERKALVRVLAINPEARKLLCIFNAGYQKILQPGEDELIEKGFSHEQSESNTKTFEEFINAHKDDIEALRIIYNNAGEPLTYQMLVELQHKLLQVTHTFSVSRLWHDYQILYPEKVKKFTSQEEKDAITNIIQIIRFAFHIIPELRSLPSLAAQRFELWCGQAQRPLTDKQKDIVKQIVGYIVTNGFSTLNDIRQYNTTIAAQLASQFGAEISNTLSSLSQFLIYNKKAA